MIQEDGMRLIRVDNEAIWVPVDYGECWTNLGLNQKSLTVCTTQR